MRTNRLNAAPKAIVLRYNRFGRLAQLLERAQSTIGYLKIVTPHKRSGTYIFVCMSIRCKLYVSPDSGVKHFVYKDGERIEKSLQAGEKAKFKVQDMEEGLKRHNQLIRRQYFMDR